MRILFFIIASCFVTEGFSQQSKDSSETVQGFTHPEHQAAFPGGNGAWINYLIRTMDKSLGYKYLTVPKGAKNAKQTAVVLFTIDEKGTVTDITVENAKDLHPEITKEAIRVIANSPSWIPASEAGKPARDKRKQKLSFVSGSFP